MNWSFLTAILVAKTTVFVVVIGITLLVTRPTDMSKSGLLAIFCTQSNDFALGYPIVKALYEKTHPQYPSYLYLMAPISLVILNPIAFLFMELGKRRAEMVASIQSIDSNGSSESGSSVSNSKTKKTRASLCVNILVKVLFNPVVLMTTLGIIGNFVFHESLPPILGGILNVRWSIFLSFFASFNQLSLQVFGNAFSAAALFLLGLRMVGQMHQLRGANLVTPGILICVKW